MAGQHARSTRIPAVIAPLIVLQAINITWTKRSRGAPRAALRHAVPDAIRVPPTGNPLPEPALLYHKVQYGEGNDFRVPITDTLRLQPFNSPLYQHNVAVSRVEDDIRVVLNWEIGWFSSLNPHIFETTTPVKTFSSMADL
jgi:hypothetical protein